MKVKNYMEVVLDHMLLNILKKNSQRCQCERCLADIKALALNNLPTKYVATEVGEVYSKIDALSVQLETDVTRAVIEAAKKVQDFPRH